MSVLTIATNDRNDIYLDASGNLAISTDLDAVMDNCKTAMQAQLYEMIYSYDTGMPNRDTAYNRYDPVQFEAAGRATLLSVAGVIEVSGFTVGRDSHTLVYTATIKTSYGSAQING